MKNLLSQPALGLSKHLRLVSAVANIVAVLGTEEASHSVVAVLSGLSLAEDEIGGGGVCDRVAGRHIILRLPVDTADDGSCAPCGAILTALDIFFQRDDLFEKAEGKRLVACVDERAARDEVLFASAKSRHLEPSCR
jgi:hypothetical protein